MTISNRTLTGRRAVAVIVALTIVLAALLGMVAPRTGQAAEGDETQSTFTVYLQAGHSPSPLGSGNISSGVREVDLNEQITQKTYKELASRGIKVKLVNPIGLDSSLSSVIKDAPNPKGQYSYYSPEPAMLTALTTPERFDTAETKQADLVIGLHHNAYSNRAIRGYEIYYSTSVGGDYGRTQEDVVGSQRIAECLEDEFEKGFYVPARNPAVRINNTNNGISRNAPMPAVLIETGYMTNAQDLAACRKGSNQSILAKRIADAVESYRDKYYEEPEPIDVEATSFSVSFTELTETFRIDTTVDPADKVEKVRASVYPAGRENEVKWYTLPSFGNGRYAANLSTGDFDYRAGEYVISVFAYDIHGGQTLLGQSNPEVYGGDRTPPTAESVTARTLSAKSNAAVLLASHVQDPAGVKSVRFAVWSEENGQDDVYWYDAAQVDDSDTWGVTMTTTNHSDRAGKYIVHAYATDKRSNEGLIGQTEVVFSHKDQTPPELYGELLYRKLGSKLVVQATDVRDPSGVRSVQAALWSTSLNQQDLAWYKLVEMTEGNWAAVIDLANHKNSDGRYTLHMYGTDEEGNLGLLGALAFRLGGDTTPPTAGAITVNETAPGVATASISDVRDDKSGVSAVSFSIWTEQDGQDDIREYPATQQADGSWTAEFKAADHKGQKGPYSIHAYATDGTGNRGFGAAQTFVFGSVDEGLPTARSVTADRQTYTQGTARITVEDVQDDTGIEKVWIVVAPKTSTPGTGMIGDAGIADVSGSSRYEAALKSGSEATWEAVFNWANDFGATGTYTITAYAEDWSGKRASVGSTEVTVTSEALGSYSIMGESQTTVDQMTGMLEGFGWSNDWYGGMTARQFCELYYSICEQEGVRAEVAFSQMLVETGRLRYGNLVVREQNNFAGLGATGNAVAEGSRKANHRYTDEGLDAGIVFTSVENGIKSHVQHLKGYASTAPLVLEKAPEYDRYGYMQLGCAPTVQQLTGKWAADMQYGDSIHRYIQQMLSMSTTAPDR